MSLVTGQFSFVIWTLIQEIPLFQAGRNELFRDVTYILADEGFDFQFETIRQHQFDFFLPRLLVREPRILSDLLCACRVLLIQLDLYARTELAPSIVAATQAKKPRFGNRHPS